MEYWNSFGENFRLVGLSREAGHGLDRVGEQQQVQAVEVVVYAWGFGE